MGGVDGYPAPVVLDGARAVQVDRDPDHGGESGERLVDRVVHDLENAVVQAPLVRVADVHVGRLRTPSSPSSFWILEAS